MATATELATTLGGSAQRQSILRGWLKHRAELRNLGFVKGFQWIDGSFVEQKEPKDIDVVSFLFRPAQAQLPHELAILMRANSSIFARAQAKATYHIDSFSIDLNGSPEALVLTSRYFLSLFSHRRGDDLWKGMLQVRLEDDQDDDAAVAILGPEPVAQAIPGDIA